MKRFFSAGMSSKDTDQTDFHSENSSDIDYSAAENNLPDHVTPAVRKFTSNGLCSTTAEFAASHTTKKITEDKKNSSVA